MQLAERQRNKEVAAAVRRREEADMSARVAQEARRQAEARPNTLKSCEYGGPPAV